LADDLKNEETSTLKARFYTQTQDARDCSLQTHKYHPMTLPGEPRGRQGTAPPLSLSLSDSLNLLITSNADTIAGYALVQPNGSVLVAFGCLLDMMRAPTEESHTGGGVVGPSDVVNALLVDETRTVVTLKGKKMHVVRREPDMLVAVEAIGSLDGARHPVACSAHCICDNNLLLVAYGPGGSHKGLPQVGIDLLERPKHRALSVSLCLTLSLSHPPRSFLARCSAPSQAFRDTDAILTDFVVVT
jgi:hypothetical protein